MFSLFYYEFRKIKKIQFNSRQIVNYVIIYRTISKKNGENHG